MSSRSSQSAHTGSPRTAPPSVFAARLHRPATTGPACDSAEPSSADSLQSHSPAPSDSAISACASGSPDTAATDARTAANGCFPAPATL